MAACLFLVIQFWVVWDMREVVSKCQFYFICKIICNTMSISGKVTDLEISSPQQATQVNRSGVSSKCCWIAAALTTMLERQELRLLKCCDEGRKTSNVVQYSKIGLYSTESKHKFCVCTILLSVSKRCNIYFSRSLICVSGLVLQCHPKLVWIKDYTWMPKLATVVISSHSFIGKAFVIKVNKHNCMNSVGYPW